MTSDLKSLCEAVEATEFPERFAFIQAGSRAESSHEDAFASHVNPEIVEPIVRAVLTALREMDWCATEGSDRVSRIGDGGWTERGDPEQEFIAAIDHILSEATPP